MRERGKNQLLVLALPSHTWARSSWAGTPPSHLSTRPGHSPGAGSWDPRTLPYCPVPSHPADQDGAEPSANSVSAHNLLRLHGFTGHKDWMDKCVCLLTAFSERMRRVPVALPEMVRALSAHQQTLKQVRDVRALGLGPWVGGERSGDRSGGWGYWLGPQELRSVSAWPSMSEAQVSPRDRL